MAVNGGSKGAIQELSRPTGNSGSAYVLPSLSGEIIYIPCSVSAMRLLVTGKETNNAFAVVGTGGTAAAPIGFHFHRETHDVFLCLKGNVNVWAGEKARTMGPGDFASVPPNTIHQYQIIGDYSEFLGLIVPGGWEEFFRFIGDPYDGPLFPLTDDRNPFDILILRLKAAAQEFDMVPLPMHPKFNPQPWESTDNILANGLEPYFLENGSGPKYLVGGSLCRPLITTKQSAGKFTIGVVEGSSQHDSTLFATGTSISFDDAHHCVQVADGKIEFTVAGATAQLAAMETLFIPAKTKFSFKFASKVAKAYFFSNGGGLVELLCKAGREYDGPVIPEKSEGEIAAFDSFEKELAFRMS